MLKYCFEFALYNLTSRWIKVFVVQWRYFSLLCSQPLLYFISLTHSGAAYAAIFFNLFTIKIIHIQPTACVSINPWYKLCDRNRHESRRRFSLLGWAGDHMLYGSQPGFKSDLWPFVFPSLFLCFPVTLHYIYWKRTKILEIAFLFLSYQWDRYFCSNITWNWLIETF